MSEMVQRNFLDTNDSMAMNSHCHWEMGWRLSNGSMPLYCHGADSTVPSELPPYPMISLKQKGRRGGE